MTDMTLDEKKAFLLLHVMIFYFHGLDDDETEILNKIAEDLNAQKELDWALEFARKDEDLQFHRGRKEIKPIFLSFNKDKRIEFLKLAWQANAEKGYVTEMEAFSMFKLAKDWDIEAELTETVQNDS